MNRKVSSIGGPLCGSYRTVASADFQLADEINLGAYRVHAETALGAVDKTVTVDRYILPRFKLSSLADRRFYAPGAPFIGDVQADYFFGKPVAGKVKVVLSRYDGSFTNFAMIEGKLDAQGHFLYRQEIPTFLATLALGEGNAGGAMFPGGARGAGAALRGDEPGAGGGL